MAAVAEQVVGRLPGPSGGLVTSPAEGIGVSNFMTANASREPEKVRISCKHCHGTGLIAGIPCPRMRWQALSHYDRRKGPYFGRGTRKRDAAIGDGSLLPVPFGHALLLSQRR